MKARYSSSALTNCPYNIRFAVERGSGDWDWNANHSCFAGVYQLLVGSRCMVIAMSDAPNNYRIIDEESGKKVPRVEQDRARCRMISLVLAIFPEVTVQTEKLEAYLQENLVGWMSPLRIKLDGLNSVRLNIILDLLRTTWEEPWRTMNFFLAFDQTRSLPISHLYSCLMTYNQGHVFASANRLAWSFPYLWFFGRAWDGKILGLLATEDYHVHRDEIGVYHQLNCRELLTNNTCYRGYEYPPKPFMPIPTEDLNDALLHRILNCPTWKRAERIHNALKKKSEKKHVVVK